MHRKTSQPLRWIHGNIWSSSSDLTGQQAASQWLADSLRAQVTIGPLAGIVLGHGTFYRPRPIPKGYPKGTPGQCFKNALNLAEAYRGEFCYVEGFATCASAFYYHAWCLDREAGVVDPTWTWNYLADRSHPGKNAYLGLLIPVELARSVQERTGQYGVLGEWERLSQDEQAQFHLGG